MKVSISSLRARLLVDMLAPMLLVLLLYGTLTYFLSRQGLEDELGRRLTSIALSVAAPISGGFEAEQLTRLDDTKGRVIARFHERLEAVRAETGVRRVFLVGRDSQSLVDSDPGVHFGQRLYALEADETELERTFSEGVATSSVLFRDAAGAYYKVGYAPVRLDGEVIAVVGVEGSAEYFELLRYLASVLTFLGALAVGLGFVSSTMMARRIASPISTLVSAARRLGLGEYEEAVELPRGRAGGDEIQVLGEAFEELRSNLVDRDRQMQMMLSGIAHEIRNPLGGMKLFVGLLREDLVEDGRGEDELEKVDRIERELGYLDRVVTDFLDFARRAEPELTRFGAREFLEEIVELLAAEARATGVELALEPVPWELELTADRGRTRRAVINCVRNACQACSGEGEVRVGAADAGERGRTVWIEDDGPGIEEALIEEVLTPFFTTREKGSGLGLALTRRIVEEQNGRLTLENRAEGGLRVCFELGFDDTIEGEAAAIPEGWLG